MFWCIHYQYGCFWSKPPNKTQRAWVSCCSVVDARQRTWKEVRNHLGGFTDPRADVTRCLLFNFEMHCSGGNTVYVLCVFMCVRLGLRLDCESTPDRLTLSFLFGKTSSPCGETCCVCQKHDESKRFAPFFLRHVHDVTDVGVQLLGSSFTFTKMLN